MRILLGHVSYYQLFNADCFVNVVTLLYTYRFSLACRFSVAVFDYFPYGKNILATEGVKLI
jgi:hypothetical protein